MEVAVNPYMVNIGYDTNIDRFLIAKNSDIQHFLSYNHQNNNKKFCKNVFRDLNSLFENENLLKDINYAYDYISENFDEDLKWEWGSLENNYNICAGICFFLDRNFGIIVKKSKLAKILGIELSVFHAIINNLKKMKFFSDILTLAEKKDKFQDFVEFIPESEILLKQKKPPKKMEKNSLKSRFKTAFFHFLFHVFIKKSQLNNTIFRLSIESSRNWEVFYPKIEPEKKILSNILKMRKCLSELFYLEPILIFNKLLENIVLNRNIINSGNLLTIDLYRRNLNNEKKSKK